MIFQKQTRTLNHSHSDTLTFKRTQQGDKCEFHGAIILGILANGCNRHCLRQKKIMKERMVCDQFIDWTFFFNLFNFSIFHHFYLSPRVNKLTIQITTFNMAYHVRNVMSHVSSVFHLNKEPAARATKKKQKQQRKMTSKRPSTQ